MIRYASRAAAVVVTMMLAGSAFAQAPATTPAPATKSAPAAKMAPAEKPRTEASLECSKQADAKGLHGKERHKFRAACKKSGGKAM
ncbi:PsiF family protein [soil metagenome]